ncbi:hypothetical protein ACWC4E_05475 [Streptomyces sp. NPDC001273]|uniref:hypothetical protein n=1 Tax=unclassified Streptomyces TaxID=2593676 RepID=UPI0033E7F3CF
MPERVNGSSGVGMGARLRRYQERFEPFATRLVLGGIFVTGLVAQFVQPVGDALEGKAFLGGALLSLVGYVLYDAVKELSLSVQPPLRAQVNSSELGGFVSEAFQAREVEISFLGYTGETLHSELYHRLDALFDNPGPTRKVTVRMLVPDFEQPMTVPARVGADDRPVDDPAFRDRLLRRCEEYDGILSDIAGRLSGPGRLVVECEYRFYPGIPRDKICIFNRAQVLYGLYDVSTRMRLHHMGPEYYDPKGYKTDLHVWSRDGTVAADAAVSMWIKHIDGLWALASVPRWRRDAAA